MYNKNEADYFKLHMCIYGKNILHYKAPLIF